LTGHRLGFSPNAVNIASLGGPDLLVFVRPGILNKTPSAVKVLNLRSNACKSEDLLAFVNANNIASFLVRSLRGRSVGSLQMWAITILTFHTF